MTENVHVTIKNNVYRDEAYLALFELYESVLTWLKVLKVPRRDRNDLVQDVFAAAIQSWSGYDPCLSRPDRWLNKITFHVASHYLDKASHWREILSNKKHSVDKSLSADEMIHLERSLADLKNHLSILNPKERSILIAHDIDEIPMAEVAEQRGIPLSTAYKWRARAIKKLSKAFAKSTSSKHKRIENAENQAGDARAI